MITRIAAVLFVLIAMPASANHHESGHMPLAHALTSASRAAEDRARDANRRPAEVIAALGISPGMTVVDLIAAGGYYTEVLSLAVGASGKVYAQNPAGVLQFRNGANEKAITARLANGRLANVERLNREVSDIGLTAGSIDAVITALNFHDVYNGAGPEVALGLSQVIFGILKPGGVFGVIDHDGKAGNNNASLHRMEVSQARETLEAAGFVVTESDLLRNQSDTGDKAVFDPSVRGNTNRFLLIAQKPT